MVADRQRGGGGSGPGGPADGRAGDPAEDRKPQSDEARSAFTPPLGVPLPPVPEDEHPTSEFALPEGVAPEPETEPEGSAFTWPGAGPAASFPAFTPPHGIPKVSLIKEEAPWQDRMRTMLRMPLAERPMPDRPPRQEEEAGPAVPRVLDLTLRIGELLLAGGEGAEDVETAMLGVAHAYGLGRCEPTVTFTLLTVSYQASLVDDPVTAHRTVRRRGTDYTRLNAVYRLIHDITSNGLTLEEAYGRLAEMRRNRHPYPGWALTLASGLLAGAASMLVGGGPVVFLAAAVGAMLGDRLAWLAAGRGLPEFYQFVAAALPPAAMGVALSASRPDIQASAVITGGLFALIPGRALVAGVQDGLTGFYITAAARLLEVGYLIVGIVCGVLVVLYGGVHIGGGTLNPEAALQHKERPVIQIVAAMLLAFAFAVLLQQERHTVWVTTLNGGVAWVIYAALADTMRADPVPATAVAAGLVGLFGQLLARYRHASALPYITAAIGPLLPGSAVYFALLNFAKNELNTGISSLTKAAALALAIAIGVNLGSEMARLFLKVPGEGAGRRAAKRTRGF
ncbi:threonine/serine exporter family protein [Streptomyces triculaminicus]|uniref:Threonine/serine exporter family protein n=1 Tax=Streptomyces triculaminicus TaxID=2816232 RepID=A0A939FK97_9ACTN|nr:threonine/serine exporter family protein [Streptomyces triculaminicus]